MAIKINNSPLPTRGARMGRYPGGEELFKAAATLVSGQWFEWTSAPKNWPAIVRRLRQAPHLLPVTAYRDLDKRIIVAYDADAGKAAAKVSPAPAAAPSTAKVPDLSLPQNTVSVPSGLIDRDILRVLNIHFGRPLSLSDIRSARGTESPVTDQCESLRKAGYIEAIKCDDQRIRFALTASGIAAATAISRQHRAN